MNQREREIEAALRRKVECAGGECLKLVCPGHDGVPDRLILLPGGRVIFAELKQSAGRLSALQGWWLGRLRELGFCAEVVRDPDRIDDIERGKHE